MVTSVEARRVTKARPIPMSTVELQKRYPKLSQHTYVHRRAPEEVCITVSTRTYDAFFSHTMQNNILLLHVVFSFVCLFFPSSCCIMQQLENSRPLRRLAVHVGL